MTHGLQFRAWSRPKAAATAPESVSGFGQAGGSPSGRHPVIPQLRFVSQLRDPGGFHRRVVGVSPV
jgi:hypothetical protein